MKRISSLLVLLLFLAGTSCSRSGDAVVAGGGIAMASDQATTVADWQRELLELAFRAASAFPLDPHIKNRSRAQESVVAACLELDLAAQAERWILQIEDWRRGACHADLACWLIEHGQPEAAEPHLQAAKAIAEDLLRRPDRQDWRRDRIRASVAKALVLLRRGDEAAQYADGVVEHEAGTLRLLQADRMPPEEFAAQLAIVDGIFAHGDFEQVQNALSVCARWFDRFHAQPALRAEAERRVRTSYDKLPPNARIERLLEIAGYAQQHGDQAKARELAGHCDDLLRNARWLPEQQILHQARIAATFHRAGDTARARSTLAAALELYETQKQRILDIDRAGALRAVAEACAAMSDQDEARAMYARAVEAGVENVNSRPRAVDLTATCLSLIRTGVQPDPTLSTRLRQVCDGLGHPW